MPRVLLRRAAAATTVAGLAIVSVVAGAAAPAAAAFYAVESTPIVWEGFDDTTGYLEDAYSDYDTAGELQGWTFDAFDGIGNISVDDCSAGTGSVTPSFVNAVPPVITAGGTTTFNLTATGNVDPVNCTDFTINAVVTMQGSFVRWAYTLTGDYNELHFFGNLGSDGGGTYTQPDPTTVLESDGDASDPSLAFQATTSGTGAWNIPAGIGTFEYVASGSPATVTFVAAVADYTYLTGQAAANAYLASIASTLSTTSFGAAFPLFQGTDAPDFAAQTFTTGAAVPGVTAAYTHDANLYYGDEYFDNTDTGLTVDARIGTLPAGLTAVVSYAAVTGAPIVTLSGTPTVAGTFSVPITFILDAGGTAVTPLFSTLSITVNAATLAVTGTDTLPTLVGGAGVLMAGLVVVFMTKRRREARGL